MAMFDFLKISRKTFFNPTAWVGSNTVVAQSGLLWGVIRTNSRKMIAPAEDETFEQSVERQGLTEKDITDGAMSYRAVAFVFVLFGVAALVYSFYLLIRYVSLTGFMVGLAVTALFLSQAFKYDFWALQMRRRQLGLTFADWKKQYLRD
jgi:hypothetical protein